VSPGRAPAPTPGGAAPDAPADACPALHVERLLSGPPGATTAAVPLVALHGFTLDSAGWQPLTRHLPADRPVFGVDLPGHGHSPASTDPRAYTMAAAVSGAARALAAHGVPTAHWLGYSMGGRVALSLALSRPRACASLVLVGASPGLADASEREKRVRADEALAEELQRVPLEAFVDRWLAQPVFAGLARLGPAHIAAARARRLRSDPAGLARSLRGMGTGAMPPLWDRLGQVAMPVLLVTGALDAKFTAIADRMNALLPHARHLVIPDCGHAVHEESPAALAAAVTAFLQSADRAPRSASLAPPQA